MPLVDLQHVSRRYGRVQALDDVNLTLPPGTIGLIGNNGAGKSTLLKILLGLLRPSTGTGHVLGCELAHAGRELRGRIGYMPESDAVVPLLRGVELVTLAGDLYGMPHRSAQRRAHEVLDYVGLGELRYRRLEEYSLGNLQRLKLAAALVHDPELLLLDEPTGGLDPRGRQGMLRLLEDLIRDSDKSVILCTHLLGDVERLCEHVVLMHRGRVLESGDFRTLRRGIAGHYVLRWQGDDEVFLQALTAAGAKYNAGSTPGRAVVHVPAEWPTRRFFEIAQRSGAVLTQLKPDEENLERVFFRMTDAPLDDPSAADDSEQHAEGATHGS